MGIPCTHRLKRSALVKKKKKESATNSCYGNNRHVMFLKLRSELKKKKERKKYINMYVYAQVIQNCTSLNRENNLYDWFHQKEQLSAL